MTERLAETLVGMAVIVVAAIFLFYALNVSGSGGPRGGGYDVSARFSSASGIGAGTDVRVSGVKVGQVSDIRLDPVTFFAEVQLTLDNDIQLPVDSSAKITTDGLLGSAYIAIEPGADDTVITADGRIQYTQGSLDLLQLLQEFAPASGGS